MSQHRFIAVICFIFVFPCISGHAKGDKRMDEIIKYKDAPKWQGYVLKKDLTNLLPRDSRPDLEFACDGSPYILAWLWPNEPGVDYRNGLAKHIVIDFNGNPVKEAYDSNWFLTEKYIAKFPDTSWRQKYHNFVEKMDGWGFSDNGDYGVRLIEYNKGGIDSYWEAELCGLQPEIKSIWKVKLPEAIGVFLKAEFLDYKGGKAILIAFSGIIAHIISEKDGSLIKTIEYSPPETSKMIRTAAETFHLPFNASNAGLRFTASEIDYNPKRRLLALGDLGSRRVRIIRIDPPFDIIAELNTADNPHYPEDGGWSIRRVKFYADKYLLVDYHFGGTQVYSKYINQTAIYNIETMKICWEKNTQHIASVIISPDGKKLAFMRDMALEIGPFIPICNSTN